MDDSPLPEMESEDEPEKEQQKIDLRNLKFDEQDLIVFDSNSLNFLIEREQLYFPDPFYFQKS